MKTVFYLIRHGESPANEKGRMCGHTDWGLTDRGREQAEHTAQLFRDIPIDVILSSDLKRAMETARELAKLKDLPVQPDPGFREIFIGPWEGRPIAEVATGEPEALAAWAREMKAPPGAETIRQLYDRVRAAFERAAGRYAGKNVVIVTHATPIRLLTCVFSGRQLEEAVSVPPLSNASVAKITADGSEYKLEPCFLGSPAE